MSNLMLKLNQDLEREKRVGPRLQSLDARGHTLFHSEQQNSIAEALLLLCGRATAPTLDQLMRLPVFCHQISENRGETTTPPMVFSVHAQNGVDMVLLWWYYGGTFKKGEFLWLQPR